MARKLVAASLTVCLALYSLLAYSPHTSQPGQPGWSGTWIHVVFGLDSRAADWSGSVEAKGAVINEVLPWGFEARDRFDAENRRWQCRTELRRGRSANSFAEPFRGLFIHLTDVRADAAIVLRTKQGDFHVPISQLRYDRLFLFADGRASAQRVPAPRALPTEGGQEDFPTAATDAHGHLWVAWISFDETNLTDRLLVSCLDTPNVAPQAIPAGRYVSWPTLVRDGRGTLHLFWCEWNGKDWDIFWSQRAGDAWSKPVALLQAPGNDIFLSACCASDGTVWLVWQAFRPGKRHSDIYGACLVDEKLTRPVRLTEGDYNKWEPSIAPGPDGSVWVAYDAYENNNYDVFLLELRASEGTPRVQRRIRITGSADFEAHASVEASDERYVWVAYDAAGPNWGKDYARDSTRRHGKYAEPLHASRRIELRVYDRKTGRVLRPVVPLPQVRNPKQPSRVAHSYQDEVIRFYELPQLVRDPDGRLWVVYRLNRQGYTGHPRQGAVWELCAATYVDGRWTEAVLMPKSRGRQEQKAAIARSEGHTVLVWATGHHHVDQPYRLYAASLPPVEGRQHWPLEVVRVEPESVEPDVVPRSWTVDHEGKRLAVLFGDLHRHTEISLCTPTVDGSLTETYRYALDVARLDFLAVTDHTRDTDPYPWWLTQKAADYFYHPGYFVSIYAYERSNAIVNGGHRNVFFRDRNWPVLRSDAHYAWSGQPRPETAPDVSLYPRLRGRWAFTIAHTPGYNRRQQRGTWTFHDPQVEPVAEIFQAYRRDYERPAPGVPEEASLWYALGRGYRLGFIASSDHHSTHLSYACVWAERRDREAVFRAIQARQTYAAQDRLIVDVRLGPAFLGGEVEADEQTGPPTLKIRIRGTAPIEEIQIIRSATVLDTLRPNKPEVYAEYRDATYPGGPCYYYIRVRQVDGTVAWASPIWVRP